MKIKARLRRNARDQRNSEAAVLKDLDNKLLSLMRHMLIMISLATLAMTFLSCEKKAAVIGPPEKITFAYTESTGSALVHVAMLKGYFAEEGLDVTQQPSVDGKAALDAVIGGKASVAVAADTSIMFAVMDGEQITTLAVIATANRNMAILARKDRGISRPSDLKGKTIGVVRGTPSVFFVDAFLLAHGIDRKQVAIKDIQPHEFAKALGTGRVDAVSIWQPLLIQIQKDMGNQALTFYGETFYTFTYCVIALKDFVKQHPEAVRKLLRALIRAENFARQYPEESRQLMVKFVKTDKDFLGEIWDVYNYQVSLDQALLVNLEDQTRWALKNRLTAGRIMPNYLDFIYADGLSAVKPEAVRILR
jgi:NitT/TauT family transport system substrate-binding protein